MGLSVKVVVPHPNVTPGSGTKRGLSTEPLFQQTAWNVLILLRVGVPQERLRDRPALFWAQPRGSVSLHRRWMRSISRWTHSSEGWIRGRYSPSQRRSGIGGGVSAMLGPEGGLGHSQIHWRSVWDSGWCHSAAAAPVLCAATHPWLCLCASWDLLSHIPELSGARSKQGL